MNGTLFRNITLGRSANIQTKIHLVFLALSCFFLYKWPYKTIVLFCLFFVVAGFLVSGFLHRYCTHRSWNCPRWLEYFFVYLTSTAMSGLCITWVALHKDHHRYTDKEGDPHGHHAGLWNNLAIFSYVPTKGSASRWMLKDPLYRMQMEYYWVLVALGGLVWTSIFSLYSWILFTTTVFVWQVSINLIGHSKLFESVNRSHFLAALWGGELYHNDHHKNPMKTRLGKFDFPYLFMIKWYK